jgi:putative transposase
MTMPRKSRIDAAGAVHHIMVRGIERRPVFRGDSERDHFLERLGEILQGTQTPCYAWALMPNHAHLVKMASSYHLFRFRTQWPNTIGQTTGGIHEFGW